MPIIAGTIVANICTAGYRALVAMLITAFVIAAVPAPAAAQAPPPTRPDFAYDDRSGELKRAAGISDFSILDAAIIAAGVLAVATVAYYAYSRANSRPTISIDPPRPQFGEATQAQPAQLSLELVNRGRHSIVVRTVAVDGEGFSVAELPRLPLTLGPAERTRISLGFSPARARQYSGELQITTTSSDGKKRSKVATPLRGRGVEVAAAAPGTDEQSATVPELQMVP